MTDSLSTIDDTFRHKFSILLLSLILILVVSPLLDPDGVGGLLWTIGLTAMFLIGSLVNLERKWVFRTTIPVVFLAILTSWAALIMKSNPVCLTQFFVVAIFTASLAAFILISVLFDDMKRTHAILGAICVYLLIGLTWAVLYSALELIEPEPFAFDVLRHERESNGLTSFSQLTYFSFVTMSTLGYGDITPRTELAETICWIQSVVGQLYIAILVAWLVNALPNEKRGQAAGNDEDTLTKTAEINLDRS